MLNILVPMAGRGSRFAKDGYQNPKPLIDVLGAPMIRWVIANLQPSRHHRFIFVCQNEHLERFALHDRLLNWAGANSVVLGIDGVTEGAACTALRAKNEINTEDPLMIANSDQWIDFNIDEYLEAMDKTFADGMIMTMRAHDPKWSFVEYDEGRQVVRVVEKEVVSDEATVGIYNFSRGRDFVSSAEAMIARNLRVNGEFYVAPVYNQMVSKEKIIRFLNIGADQQGMYGLGIPSDLTAFTALERAKEIALEFK